MELKQALEELREQSSLTLAQAKLGDTDSAGRGCPEEGFLEAEFWYSIAYPCQVW